MNQAGTWWYKPGQDSWNPQGRDGKVIMEHYIAVTGQAYYTDPSNTSSGSSSSRVPVGLCLSGGLARGNNLNFTIAVGLGAVTDMMSTGWQSRSLELYCDRGLN